MSGNYIPSGLPVVSWDTVRTHATDMTTNADDTSLYANWKRTVGEHNPVVVEFIGLFGKHYSPEVGRTVEQCMLGLYKLLESQAESDRIGKSLSAESREEIIKEQPRQ